MLLMNLNLKKMGKYYKKQWLIDHLTEDVTPRSVVISMSHGDITIPCPDAQFLSQMKSCKECPFYKMRPSCIGHSEDTINYLRERIINHKAANDFRSIKSVQNLLKSF